MTKGLKILLITYGVLFAVQLFSGTLGIKAFIQNTFFLSAEGTLGNLYLWQPLTYQFFHGDFMHILFNGFVLYSFGAQVEGKFRQWWRFVLFVIACGVAGGLLDLLVNALFAGHVGPNGWSLSKTVGASGGIYGVIAAFCVYNWRRPIQMLFVPRPVEARWLLPIFVGIDILFTTIGGQAISLPGHLGGMFAGLLFASGLYNPSDLTDRVKLWRARRRLKALRGGGHPLEQNPDKKNYYH